MNPRIRSWIGKIKAVISLVFNTIQLISALIAILATTAGTIIAAWILHLENWILPAATFILGISIMFILVLLFSFRGKPSKWLLKGYRYIEAEYFYKIHPEDIHHHSLTVSVTLEAVKPEVSIFEDRYLWTGQGKEETPLVISPGHKIMGESIQKGSWKYYYVYLGKELNVGDRTKVETYQELYDEKNKFVKFLAKTVAEPVDKLILRVALPSVNVLSQVILTETDTYGPASHLVNQTKFDLSIHVHNHIINYQKNEIIWSIPSPTFGHRYELSWQLNDQK